MFKYQNVLILYCEYQNFSDALKHCCILEEIVIIIRALPHVFPRIIMYLTTSLKTNYQKVQYPFSDVRQL